MKQEKLNLGIRRKVGSKLSFRPKNREEKELRGENGAFDTETSGFGGGRASPFGLKTAKKWKTAEKYWFWVEQRHKKLKFWEVQTWGYNAPFEKIFGPFESYW